MILTVTLSPAFDRTYYVDNFDVSSLNRAWQVKVNMGGKGINFSSIIGSCGILCTACGFMGEGGERFENFLQGMGVCSDFVEIEGEIRTNIKICDISKGTYTDLNECSGQVFEKDIKRLYKKVGDLAKKNKFLYMGGTLPPGAEPGIYADLIKIGRERGVCTVLDASGEALRLGIEACPDIIKPNKSEAEEFLGRKIKTLNDAAEGAKEMVRAGAGTVLLSLGGDGAICADRQSTIFAKPLCVDVKSTVGAGDSFLAGFIYGKSKNLGNMASLKYAASFSAAKIQTEGVDLPTFKELTSYTSKIICEEIN